MAWTLKDIPTFYLVNGERVDYTEDERKALLTEWKADDTRIENEKIVHLRKQRDFMLSQSDWTQNRDITLSNDADWKTYRQALRDITKEYKSLEDVKWPEKPEWL